MWLLAPFRLLAGMFRRFHAERCAQTAAALSFATLLGLVPMIAIAVALISLLPAGAGLGPALEKFLLANLLPDKAGTVIAKYVGQFALRADKVTLLGVVFLGVTALMQMLTIERAFNQIWRVQAKRPFVRRIAMHVLALLVGPLAFGAAIAGITFLVSASFGLMAEPPWFSRFILRGAMPFVVMATLFGLLYWGVPHRPVKVWHAAWGGIVAAAGFAALQKLFSIYIASVKAGMVIYGTFSAFPVFLLWLYASWTVILVGALLVAELPEAGRRRGRDT